jgi:tetratricopeptide (TPR) repeat protein
MLPEELLNLLEQARQTADPARARALLSKALKTDPKSEEAWLLFSEVAEKNEHAIYCLEQVLKINPANLQAAQKLDALKTPPEPIPASPAVPELGPIPASTVNADTEPIKSPQPLAESQPTPPAKPNLQPEAVLRTEKIHWAIGIGPFLLLILGLVISSLSAVNVGTSVAVLDIVYPFLLIIGLIIVILGVIYISHYLAVYSYHTFSLNTERIIARKGLKSSAFFEMPIIDIETITVHQSLAGRTLGFGNITLIDRDGIKVVLKGISHPVEFCRAVQAQMTEMQKSHPK